MTGYPLRDGGAVRVIAEVVQTAVASRLQIVLILSGDHQVFVGLSSQAALGGVGGLHQQGQGIGVVAQLPVGQAVQVLGRGLQADAHSLQLHVDQRLGAQ